MGDISPFVGALVAALLFVGFIFLWSWFFGPRIQMTCAICGLKDKLVGATVFIQHVEGKVIDSRVEYQCAACKEWAERIEKQWAERYYGTVVDEMAEKDLADWMEFAKRCHDNGACGNLVMCPTCSEKSE